MNKHRIIYFFPLILTFFLIPTVSALTNYADVPGDWNLRDLGTVDNTVLHNGSSSIRVDGPPTEANPYRECNTYSIIPCNPGDHITYSIWIKTDASTATGAGGALMGIDLYGSSGRLWEVCPGTSTNYVYDPTWSWQSGYQWVPYNTDWTLLTLDYYIPYHVFATTDAGANVPLQYANGFVAWFYMHNEVDAGAGYFADATLNIIPASSNEVPQLNVENLGATPSASAQTTLALLVGVGGALLYFFWIIIKRNNI